LLPHIHQTDGFFAAVFEKSSKPAEKNVAPAAALPEKTAGPEATGKTATAATAKPKAVKPAVAKKPAKPKAVKPKVSKPGADK
jgi:hypothetical protein